MSSTPPPISPLSPTSPFALPQEHELSPRSKTLPRPIQFITINEQGSAFDLHENVIQEVLDKVPEHMPICVVSVVGAFRTGKSFALDLFLRYLRHTSDHSTPPHVDGVPTDEAEAEWRDWLYSSGLKLEGVSGIARPEGGHSGFSWRAGKERNTTGMWIWNEPFIRRMPKSQKNPTPSTDEDPNYAKLEDSEEVAVLLVDTQGMFDMQTGQMLTVAIFAFSTLISSFLVYNVDKRIQEDNLQHLTLFTEYGRIALASQDSGSQVSTRAPFQTLLFLVRDWQDFEDEDDVNACILEMKPYLHLVLNNETAVANKDLAEVRDHINLCFERPDVFMLPNPGLDVAKKNYDGNVTKISKPFKALLHRLVMSIFGVNKIDASEKEETYQQEALVPKRIGGRLITSKELMSFIRCYVRVFQQASGGIFPEAKTLLNATAETNNFNAAEAAEKIYKENMDKLCGAKQPYVEDGKIEEHSEECKKTALRHFDRMAKMGKKESIQEFREKLESKMKTMKEEYIHYNKAKQPDILRFVSMVMIAASVSYLLSSVVEILCTIAFLAPRTPYDFDYEPGDFTFALSLILGDIYTTAFCFLTLVMATTGWSRLAPAVHLATELSSSISKE